MQFYHTGQNPLKREEHLARAVAMACKIALINGTSQVLIAIHSLDNYGNILENVIGLELKKHRHIVIEEVDVLLEGKNTKKTGFDKGVIVVPFGSLDLLAEKHKDMRGTDVIFLPWMENEYIDYLQNFPDSLEINEKMLTNRIR